MVHNGLNDWFFGFGHARGKKRSDEDDRIQALLRVSSLLAFQPGRSVSMRAMRWTKIGSKVLQMVLSARNAQIDAIEH